MFGIIGLAGGLAASPVCNSEGLQLVVGFGAQTYLFGGNARYTPEKKYSCRQGVGIEAVRSAARNHEGGSC